MTERMIRMDPNFQKMSMDLLILAENAADGSAGDFSELISLLHSYANGTRTYDEKKHLSRIRRNAVSGMIDPPCGLKICVSCNGCQNFDTCSHIGNDSDVLADRLIDRLD